MKALRSLLRRDLAQMLLGARRGGAVLPILFFLAVAMLYPFAIGPDAPLLARTGGGVIWVAALLAAILPLDRLVEPDIELGMFDQWALRGISEEWVIAVRVLAHWLSFGPPLMLAAVPASALLGIGGEALRIEFRDSGDVVEVPVHAGLADWDEPEARVHRGVNAGSTPYEEIVTFFLSGPGMDPQPEHA